MTLPTIYMQLKKHAKPVLTDYKTDLTKHDRDTCRTLRPGDFGFWAVRKWGTHMQVASLDDQETVDAYYDRLTMLREYLNAIVGQDRDTKFYFFECVGANQRGHVWPTTYYEVMDRIVRISRLTHYVLQRSETSQ